jgi:thiamine-monophosphate kinase
MKEFQLIQQIQQGLSVSAADNLQSGVILGIGDDAAVVEVPAGRHLVAATDTLNAGVHFPVATLPFDIAYKCLAVNLSDMAAMGAIPRWALLSLSLPEAGQQWVMSFIDGFNSLANNHGVVLIGGDTTHGPLSVSLTALGLVKPGMQLVRHGAKPGDLLVVSGTVGGAARVLDLLQQDADSQAGGDLKDRRLLDRPVPRVELGQCLPGYATSCIDISDGLLADLGHVLAASSCGASIVLEKLPGDEILNGLENHLKWNYQLSGGDDYELLFTLPPEHREMLNTWSHRSAVELSIIGEIEEQPGIRCTSLTGERFDPQQAGFEHFQKNDEPHGTR